MMSFVDRKNIKVIVFYTEGCPATPPTLKLIERIADEVGLLIELRDVLIGLQSQAEEFRFLGSPTVQINGLDIDLSARDSQFFGIM